MDELDILISSLSFITLREKILLRNNLDSLDELAVLSIEEIAQIIGRPIKRAVWNGKEARLLVHRSRYIMETQSITAARYDSAVFPALLREINDPPYMIYYRGNIQALEKKCVSVVGTRQVCQEAARAAFGFSRDAADDGLCVVSGLANGIDGFAHSGALASGKTGCTAAVLPCGIDTITPGGHKGLAKRILLAGGCILSEYIPGTPGEHWRFVQRNRIIAALSPATVVVQAPPGSGALITADFAVDYNRELIFHRAQLCDDSLRTCRRVEKYLESQAAEGKVKNIRTPESYIEDGAPLIDDYEDFVDAMLEAPGPHFYKNKKQLNLFE